MNHIEKIKYRTFYGLNESAKYREVKENTFDVIPDDLLEDNGDEEAVENEPTNQEVPDPPQDDNQEDEIPDEGGMEGEPEMSDLPVSPEEEGEGVDELQNEIIKLNTLALNNLNQKLDDLRNMTVSLNDKIKDLSYDVEEVREPDTEEKFLNQKNVSFPYYANLNDYWSGNWFEQQKQENRLNDVMDGGTYKGIRDVGDNTYIADFDDLPKTNELELKDSFNEYV
ncbi:MAG: hypothetical protein ACOCVF_00470 [bacterium]